MTDEQIDLLEAAWGVIANVSGSDWTKQSPEWQAAAANWRQRYHAALDATGGSVQAKIDERGRLGQELIDSQAPERAAAREESRR